MATTGTSRPSLASSVRNVSGVRWAAASASHVIALGKLTSRKTAFKFGQARANSQMRSVGSVSEMKATVDRSSETR